MLNSWDADHVRIVASVVVGFRGDDPHFVVAAAKLEVKSHDALGNAAHNGRIRVGQHQDSHGASKLRRRSLRKW